LAYRLLQQPVLVRQTHLTYFQKNNIIINEEKKFA